MAQNNQGSDHSRSNQHSGIKDDEILPFPTLSPQTTAVPLAKQIHRPTRLPIGRRSRADTLPSSFSYTFPFAMPAPPPGLKPSTSNSDLKAISSSSIPTPKSIPAMARASSGGRHRGATFSVPPSSLSAQFQQTSPFGYNNSSHHHNNNSYAGLAVVDETDQNIARSLGYLGLDDPDTTPHGMDSRHHIPEAKAIQALKNLGRNRSRSFNTSGHYEQQPNPPSHLGPNANPPQPNPPTRMTLRQARARAISVGFLNQDELFDAFPELNELNDESDDESNYHNNNNARYHDDQMHWDHNDYDEYNEMAPPPPPSRSIWVGNLDPSVTANELLALFSPYGPIESLRVLPDKECAFINFHALDDAIRAKDDMQGGRMGALNLRIGFGKADPTNQPNHSEIHDSQPTRALWIGNISASTSSAILQSIFSNFGQVESARVLVHKNCGFVNFTTAEAAQKARDTMNNKEISGSVVRIGYAKVPPQAEVSTKPSRPIVPIPLSQLGIQIPDDEEGNDSSQTKEDLPVLVEPITFNEPNGQLGVFKDGKLLNMDEELISFPYKSSVPSLPTPELRLDQAMLRDRRKMLDHNPSKNDFDNIFNELIDMAVELCTDYIGNTVVQKLMELGSDSHRTQLIQKVSPYMASIGCHKNGTWAIQKILDCSTTSEQMRMISESIKPYTPPLLLDQYGNYVVQCCLRFKNHNQFIFEAIHARFWDVVHGRFGTRAVRTCLDSKFTTNEQKKLVAIALVNHGLFLATDVNGSILLTWLLDTSTVSGRYTSLVPQFIVHLPVLCTHKLASLTILKIINQRVEPIARQKLLEALFFTDDGTILESVLSDQNYGLGLVQKILQSSCIDQNLKDDIAHKVRQVLKGLQVMGYHSYGPLLDDLSGQGY